MLNVRLRRNGETLVIGADFWDEVLDWAEDHGWRPRNPPTLYRTDSGLTVSDFEAGDLADALEVIAGDIALHDYDVPETFIRELIDALSQLNAFCQSGSFRIC